MANIHVTDHALVRWLERVGGIDMDYFRQYIASLLEESASCGFSVVTIDGFTYMTDPKTKNLITVLDNSMREKNKKKSKMGAERKYGDRDDEELDYLDVEAAE